MSDTDFEFGHNAENEPAAVPEACMGNVTCEHCGKRHGYCSEVEQQLKEGTMLPKADSDGSSQSSGTKKKGGIKYLTIEDLSRTPKEAKILAVKADADNRYGARVVLKISLDGTMMFWGVAIRKNPNYRLLTDKLGHEENDWVDARILLHNEKDEFSEQFFPRVSFPTETRSSARSGR